MSQTTTMTVRLNATLSPDGDIGIVTILHERMHQIGRFKDDFFGYQAPPGSGKDDT